MNKQDFILTITELRKGFEKNPVAWQHKTVADFLEAIEAYAEDVQGYYDNTHQNINAELPSWRVFADILEGASVYE